MKLLVETTGPFQFVVPEYNEIARHEGYSVVRPTASIQEQVARGNIRVVGTVNDEATDEMYREDLAEFENDHDAARDSFLSSFPEKGDVVYGGGPVLHTNLPKQENPFRGTGEPQPNTVLVDTDKGDHSADGMLDDNPTKEPTARASPAPVTQEDEPAPDPVKKRK